MPNIFLAKVHPSHLRLGLLIGEGIRTGDIPAVHASALHGQPLRLCHTKPLVVIIGQLTVLGRIIRRPVAGVVTVLTAFDADQFSCAGEYREAQLRQSLRQLRCKAFLFRLDAPVIRIPEVDIQLTSAIHEDLLLFKVFSPAI